jgi:hypothetical protein
MLTFFWVRSTYGKKEIFLEIVELIRNDYSGYRDKINLDKADFYIKKVEEAMDELSFGKLIRLYLMEFRDEHLKVFIPNDFTVGFRVRRFENKLYIISTNQETRVQVGDYITHLDGQSIDELESQYELLLNSKVYERQNWDLVLKEHQVLTLIKRDGTCNNMQVLHYTPSPSAPVYKFYYDAGLPILKLTDFDDTRSIEKVIQEMKARLKEDVLVIDVRYNNGGSDLSYFPLLDLIFDQKIALSI